MNDTFTNKDGNTVVTLSSHAARSKLVQVITESFPQSSIQQPKEKQPTISISGIKSEMTAKSLSETIRRLYPEIKSLADAGETFSIISIIKQKNSTDANPLY